MALFLCSVGIRTPLLAAKADRAFLTASAMLPPPKALFLSSATHVPGAGSGGPAPGFAL